MEVTGFLLGVAHVGGWAEQYDTSASQPVATGAANTDSAPCSFSCVMSGCYIDKEYVSDGRQVLIEAELQAPDAHHDDDAAVAPTCDDRFE